MAKPTAVLGRVPFSLMNLVIFHTVVRAGGMKAASLALSMSQVAVSKSVASLEQVLVVTPSPSPKACIMLQRIASKYSK